MNLDFDENPVIFEDLHAVFERAVRIVVKEDPMEDSEILFESSDRSDIEDLQRCMLIDIPEESFHCMCIGAPAIYLYDSSGKYVELTNHHGDTVRCSLWDSDVPIKDTEKWLSWFDRRNISGPREEVEGNFRYKEQYQKDWARWYAAMPKPISEDWSNSFFDDTEENNSKLRAVLEQAVPDEIKRIQLLLEWFGSGAGTWSEYPEYEAIAEKLLLLYPTKKIVEAILLANLGPALAEGSARLFGGWAFQHQHPKGLNDVPDSLKSVLWTHVKDTKDEDKLHRAAQAFRT